LTNIETKQNTIEAEHGRGKPNVSSGRPSAYTPPQGIKRGWMGGLSLHLCTH